jgi:hypothetical protein
MPRIVSITLTDEEVEALNEAQRKINKQIQARNLRIEAEKQLALAQGVAYVGPEPEPEITFDELVQMRVEDRVMIDRQDRARAVSEDIARLFLSLTRTQQRAMMEDIEKYRTPQPVATSEPELPPTTIVRKRKT